jgi:hypothetical protein
LCEVLVPSKKIKFNEFFAESPPFLRGKSILIRLYKCGQERQPESTIKHYKLSNTYLIQLFEAESNAKFGRGQMNTAFSVLVLGVKFSNGLLTRRIIRHLDAFVPATANVTLIEMHSKMCTVALGVQILFSNLKFEKFKKFLQNFTLSTSNPSSSATCWIIVSVANMPWGPPNPLKTVKLNFKHNF